MITQKVNPTSATSINKLLGFSTNYGGFYSRWALCFLLLSLMSLLATAQNAAPPPPNDNNNNNGSAPKFNLKMAIVMCLLVAVFFILGFLSVYARQCAQQRLRGRVDLALGTARGLDPEIIETFPTFVYATVKAHKIGSGSLECAVCLNEFQDDETLRLIPKCDHVFHPDCIDMWLISHSTCPVCRTNLVPKPGELPYTGYEQYFDSDTEPDQPDQRPHGGDESQPQRQVSVRVTVDDQDKDKEATEQTNLVNANKTTNQSLPPRSRSTGFGPPRSTSSGWRFSGLFPRSMSTGHNLLVRPGENSERYTLKLPEEVRNKLLMNSALNRNRSSNAALPRVGSTRRGYRSPSIRNFRQNSNSSPYERFDDNARSDRWHISMTPPFVHRSSSVRSSMGMGDDSVAAVPACNRPPLESKVVRKDEDGQRSTDLLRPEDQV